MSMPRLNIFLRGEAVPTIEGRTDLIIGTLPSANDVAGKHIPSIEGKTRAELDAMFGARSDLRNRIEKWLRTNEANSRLDIKTLAEEAGGVEAEGKITLTGTATAKGELYIAVVDEKQFFATIPVEIGETANDIATKIVNAFSNTIFENIPITASLDEDDAKFTAVDKGTVGNYYGLKVVGAVAGITVGIEAFTGGATDPTLTASDIPDRRFTGVNLPRVFNASVDLIIEVFESRFNTQNGIMDGSVFMGYDANFSDYSTLADSKNKKCLFYVGNRIVPSPNPKPFNIQTGGSILTPADWRVCEFMGIRSRRLTPNAVISDFVFANNLDNFGGPELASLPYFNTPMKDTALTSANLLFNETEKRLLEDRGVTIIDVNSSESGMLMGSVVSTYKFDDKGTPDLTWKYLNYIDTGSVCREYIFNNMKSDLAQSRLTEGDLVPNRNINNAGSIEALFMKYYADLAGVLFQDGGEIVAQVSDNVSVTLDLPNRLVGLLAIVPIVSQIGQVNMVITQKFSVT